MRTMLYLYGLGCDHVYLARKGLLCVWSRRVRACSGDDHPHLPCPRSTPIVRVVASRARVLSVGRFRVPPTRPGPTVWCAVHGRVAAPPPLNRNSY